MEISGRSIAYVLILLIAFAVGGFTFVGAQGFVEQLPVPVEENGIVEIFRDRRLETFSGVDCNFGDITIFPYDVVPPGKRLIIENVTAHVTKRDNVRTRGNAEIVLGITEGDGDFSQTIATSHLFPLSFVGPLTAYANPGQRIAFKIACPSETPLTADFEFKGSITGRLVPYPHPATIPTATPPP